jgi:anti-sigma factor RsiW
VDDGEAVFERRESQTNKHLTDDRLSAYMDGQVTAAERTRVEAHLAGCPACAGELHALRSTVRLLREMPPAPLPRAFTIPASTLSHRASLWNMLTRGWGYRALQGATALAAMLLMMLCSGDLLLQSLSTMMPMAAMPAAMPSQQAFAQPTAAGPVVLAPTSTPSWKAAESAAPSPPQPRGTATREGVETPAPAAPTIVALTQAGETQTPLPVGAGALPTAVPPSAPPPAAASPTLPEGATSAKSAPTPTLSGEDRAQTTTPPAMTAPVTITEAVTETTLTPNALATAMAYGTRTEATPPPVVSLGPAPVPDVAQPSFDMTRLAVCGIEGTLLVAVVGLLVVTGAAWFARRQK